ncbi:uncharacterized protein LOC129892674 [Solanum dulcamara]|uniref:uncharacterized protein LOC129892674 n=1 Tax=Solanum dulcamara TaxID=45834 RepID=UPI00248591F9|nr:uncharacterized protein LOC129892674 [Solanum dulcamara]
MPQGRVPPPRAMDANEAQVSLVPDAPHNEVFTHLEFRNIITLFTQDMVNQANQGVVPPPPQMPTSTIRIWDFKRMNLPKFDGSKVDEDPIKFIDESYQIVAIMGVPPNGNAKLVAYQLKHIARVRYEQWIVDRGEEDGNLREKSMDFKRAQTNNGSSFANTIVSRPNKEERPFTPCERCGRTHQEQCMAGKEGCYKYGDMDYKMTYSPVATGRGRDMARATSCGMLWVSFGHDNGWYGLVSYLLCHD